MLYSIVAVLVLVVDQAVKFYTVNNIEPKAIGDACKTLIPGVIHMTNVQNYGAAFSILENAQTVLIVVSIVFIIGIIALISMDIIHTRFGRWTAVLVMAGALGNCIDRILLGYVVDMFEFELFNFAVFNVADVFITVCGILFCVHVIVYREPEEERNAVPRPEKKRSGLFAPRQKAEEDVYDAEEEEPVPAPRRPAKAPKAAKAAKAAPADRRASRRAPKAPRSDRSAHTSLEDDLRPLDPDDPFAEWDNSPAAPAQPAAEAGAEQSAPKEPARPAKRRTALTIADDEDDYELDMPAPRKPAKPEKKAAAAPVQEPDVPLSEPLDDTGFDEYSLDDILAEFRDD